MPTERRPRQRPDASATTLYDELRASHEIQRALCRSLTAARTDVSRSDAFSALAIELAAHAAAEERFLYVPMLMDDAGLSTGRHALAEHHEADEMVDVLRALDPGGREWALAARELAKAVRHHLEEEERGFFQLSGRILTDRQKVTLAGRYRRDYERMKRRLTTA